jgi:hypothetical protein
MIERLPSLYILLGLVFPMLVAPIAALPITELINLVQSAIYSPFVATVTADEGFLQ